MAKLIELKEAAEQLGLTPEALTELVDQKKIFGYRDGASWKFKPTEIERVKGELGAELVEDAADAVADTLGGVGLGDDDDMIDVGELELDDEAGDDADSILISEEELGRSDDSTSSTIIGQASDIASADSDINISAEEAASAAEGGSDLSLADDDLGLAPEEDVELGLASDDDELTLAVDGGSDLSLADDSDLNLATDAGASDVLAGDSDLLSVADGGTGAGDESGIDLSLADDAGGASAGSSLSLSESDALSLDDSDLSLSGDSGSGSGSGVGADSSLELDLDDDDLLAGSGMGSDITLGASDSGINLSNPSDSGISLEDVGSGIDSTLDSSLELGDDDMIELEAEPVDAEDATELQTDDEFMLTPVAGDADLDEESDDSGSQVIALDSDEFDESAATMLVPDEDPLGGEEMDDIGSPSPVVAPSAAPATAKAADEAEFTTWNIAGLVMLAVFMLLCSLLALDVARNIWTWNEPFSISTSLMNLITG